MFIASAVEFVRRHDLDGFDVDWEYPGLRGNGNVHRPEDQANVTALMAELRTALDGATRNRRLLLTFAAGASTAFLEHTENGQGPGVGGLAARGESPAAFDGRCIPPLGVARRSNIPDVLTPRAWIGGRFARLGATRHFHHGLLVA